MTDYILWQHGIAGVGGSFMILATLVELSHCRLTQIKRHSTLLSNKIELKTFPWQLFTKCPHPRFNKRPFRNSTNSVNNQSSSVNITDKKTTKRKFMKLIFLDYTPRWRKECSASYFRSSHDAMMIIRAVFVSSHRLCEVKMWNYRQRCIEEAGTSIWFFVFAGVFVFFLSLIKTLPNQRHYGPRRWML